MSNYLALTIIADDCPGIVEKVADSVAANGGNWLESSMSRLAGKFAGILLVGIPEANQAALLLELNKLAEQGIRVTAEPSGAIEPSTGQLLSLTVVGNDRPGIVGEISTILAQLRINVEDLTTCCESAPMTADPLFKATAHLQLPAELNREGLQDALEALSDDLMVELEKA